MVNRLLHLRVERVVELVVAGQPREWADDSAAMGVDALAQLQDRLYAQDRWAVLLIFQAMDAAGKDDVCPADRALPSGITAERHVLIMRAVPV